MKNLFALILTTSIVASFTSQAAGSVNIQFVGADDSAETNLCLVAVEKGLRAAKQAASDSVDVNSMVCNGLNIKKFSQKYQAALTTTTTNTYATTYEFVPANNADESKVCTVAAKEGYQAALAEGGYRARGFYCNGTQIKSFAKKYAKV